MFTGKIDHKGRLSTGNNSSRDLTAKDFSAERADRALELDSIKKRKKSVTKNLDATSIEYGYTQRKSGRYGVFVRALSGRSLDALAYKFPDFNVGAFKGQLNLRSYPPLATLNNKKECQRFISELKARPEHQQIERIIKCRIWIARETTR